MNKYDGHTPGPWEINPYSQDSDVQVDIGIAHGIEKHKDGTTSADWICCVVDGAGSCDITEQMEADAVLIADAPALLALCQKQHEEILRARCGAKCAGSIKCQYPNECPTAPIIDEYKKLVEGK